MIIHSLNELAHSIPLDIFALCVFFFYIRLSLRLFCVYVSEHGRTTSMKFRFIAGETFSKSHTILHLKPINNLILFFSLSFTVRVCDSHFLSRMPYMCCVSFFRHFLYISARFICSILVRTPPHFVFIYDLKFMFVSFSVNTCLKIYYFWLL